MQLACLLPLVVALGVVAGSPQPVSRIVPSESGVTITAETGLIFNGFNLSRALISNDVQSVVVSSIFPHALDLPN